MAHDSTATWTGERLATIGRSEEIGLSSARADGTLRPYVIMWVVRAGETLCPFSARPANPWYMRAAAVRSGRIRADGQEHDVAFAPPATDVHADIDAAYHAKYDRYGPAIVGSVVGEKAREVTLRLLPRN